MSCSEVSRCKIDVMEFVALDVETANRAPSSICAIAIAGQDGANWIWAVRPEPFWFEQLHHRLHGITAASVEHAPSFATLWPEVVSCLQGRVLVAHNAGFDTTAILSACRLSNLPVPDCRVLCSLQLARSVWPELPSHSLESLARHLGIPLVHHDVASDARAAFTVVERAILQCNGSSLEDVLARHDVRCEPLGSEPSENAHPEKETVRLRPLDLCGKRVAFTGSMLSMTRTEAERLVSEYGGTVTNSVSKTLDLLVVGGGGGAGEKLDRARRLVASGTHLKILTEDEFLETFSSESTEIVTRILRTHRERSHGGAGFAIDIGDYLTSRASTDPEFAALLAAEESRLASLSPEERRALDTDIEEQAAEERAFKAEVEMIQCATDDQHAQFQNDRKAGIIGSQTEVGQAFGLSAREVGRILDAYGLRDRVDVDVDGVPEHLRRHVGIYPPLFGTRYVKIDGGPLHLIRAVAEGFAVHDPFDGRDYWVASKVAPLLAPHSRKGP